MILSTLNWTKITNEFQKVINAHLAWNGKMDKDKWNALNFNFKKIVDYCKGIGHNTSFWDLIIYRWQNYICHDNSTKSITKLFEIFQGKWNMNAPFHARDLQMEITQLLYWK